MAAILNNDRTPALEKPQYFIYGNIFCFDFNKGGRKYIAYYFVVVKSRKKNAKYTLWCALACFSMTPKLLSPQSTKRLVCVVVLAMIKAVCQTLFRSKKSENQDFFPKKKSGGYQELFMQTK